MTIAYLNRISTAVPPHDVHEPFVAFARDLLAGTRALGLFDRMVERSQIRHRWSPVEPLPGPVAREGAVDADGFYVRRDFPTTAARMKRFEAEAPSLAERAVRRLGLDPVSERITHVVVVTCTGFIAPGLDLDLVRRCGLDPCVERTTIRFMGCQAGINGLRIARHIVRSDPEARVLLLSVELCSLHLQETQDLNQTLSFLIFGDGSAAALVTARPVGLALSGFRSILVPETEGMITWTVRDSGFEMFLSGRVPAAVGRALGDGIAEILGGLAKEGVDHWAVHPGGRSILDAVEASLDLPSDALVASRRILRDFGNMSSATVLFVLADLLQRVRHGERGCALAFGPGLTAEGMMFEAAG